MRLSFILAPTMLMCAQLAVAQTIPEADARRFMEQLQASHIQGNVPDDALFARLLQRDLRAYFAGKGFRKAAVSYDLLRREPTQVGVGYPKFYLWVHVRSHDGRVTSGAVRVAAVERKRFDVTTFLSAKEIDADPSGVASVFPASLVQEIIKRAAREN